MAKSNSEFKSIQKKLVAAVAMVLVASIMVVSSSYAWFTLSTAPEVTGIQTAVGSNGNLEIALRTGELTDIPTGIGAAFPAANNSWGNLIDLSDASYHMDQMALRPSRLNATLDLENTTTSTHQTTKDGVPVWKDTEDGAEYAADEGYQNDGALKVMEGTAPNQTQKLKDDVPVWKDVSETTTTKTVTYAADAKNATDDTEVYDNAYEAYMFPEGAGYLKTPVYGADGRVSLLTADGVINGLYDTNDKAFKENSGWGVRAVGVASNISPEALALRNAKQKVNNAISSAKSTATISLRDDSVKMADIIIANVLNSSTTYGSTEVNNIRNAVNNLQSVVDELEAALVEAVIAVGVMQKVDLTAADVDFTKDDLTVDSVNLLWVRADDGNAENGDESFDLTTQKADLVAAYAKLAIIQDQIDDANAELAKDALKANSGISFTDISKPLTYLLSTNNIEIIDTKNGVTYPINDEKDVDDVDNDGDTDEVLRPGFKTYADKDAFGAVTVITGKPTISIVSGIYYNVAEFCGNYSATTSMTINGTYGSVTLNNQTIEVVMATAADGTDTTKLSNGFHLPYIVNWMSSLAVAGGSGGAQLITDIYGYAVDLAFRTNAAGSSLLLQTEAANRVDDSTATQGGGSYMEFTSGHLDFSLVQVAELMQSIRVVFMNDDGTIYGVAALQVKLEKQLDSENKPVVADESWPFYYEVEETVGTTKVVKKYAYNLVGAELTQGGTAIKSPLVLMNFTVNATTGVLTLNEAKSNAVITSLPQNTAVGISALVYLDGDTVENADVAISGNSMTGTMNLQFASDAELDPMDYTYQPTTAPSSITVDSATGALSIPKVEGATEYDVYAKSNATGAVNKKVGTVKDDGIASNANVTAQLSTMLTEPGEYTISVVAKAPNKADSDPVTATNTYKVLTKLATPQVAMFTDGVKLQIQPVTNATNFVIYINGLEMTVAAISGGVTEVDLSTATAFNSLTAGTTYNVTVVATGDTTQYQSSNASAAVSYTVPTT